MLLKACSETEYVGEDHWRGESDEVNRRIGVRLTKWHQIKGEHFEE